MEDGISASVSWRPHSAESRSERTEQTMNVELEAVWFDEWMNVLRTIMNKFNGPGLKVKVTPSLMVSLGV